MGGETGAQAPPAAGVSTAKSLGNAEPSSLSAYVKATVTGTANNVPVGPISYAGPIAPWGADTARVIVTVTACSKAFGGIVTVTAPMPSVAPLASTSAEIAGAPVPLERMAPASSVGSTTGVRGAPSGGDVSSLPLATSSGSAQ